MIPQHVENHSVFPDIMHDLNEQRKNNVLTDVTVIVGDQQIAAHKCVLVAGSEYFNSLLLGPLKQDTSEVNLSDVTDDFECTASVIDFLYTGEIAIDDEMLDGILKMASFLLISLLRETCVTYINNNMNFDTCIQYYLLSFEYMLPELSQKLSQTISSRFHDCLIFRDTSLSVSPKQLKFLMDSCDVFRHCSTSDIISFVYEWVATDSSEEKERVGCEILDYVSTLSTQMDARNRFVLEHHHSVLAENQRLQSDDGASQFATKLNSVIVNCQNESENGANPTSLQTALIDTVNPPQEIPESDSENVVIAIAPNQHFVDFVENYGNYVSRGKAVFDICIYIPHRRTWYYLTKGYRKKLFMDLSNYDAELTQTFIMNDKMCFVSPEAPSLLMFDLVDFTWSKLRFKNLIEQNDIRYDTRDVHFVISDSRELYMVLKNSSVKNDELKVFFNCYRLSLTNTWKFICSTHIMTMDTSYVNESMFSAAISSNRKEMILAYVADTLHVFVMDLETIQLSDTALCYLTADIEFRVSFFILEVEEHFCLVEDLESGNDQFKYRCRVRYKFASKELSTDDKTELAFDMFENTPVGVSGSPCRYGHTRHIWMFEGNARDGSSLKALSGNQGQLKAVSHTPPPFPSITEMVVGDVKREILDSLTPIRTYLHEQTLSLENSDASSIGQPSSDSE